uniref:Myb-like domain-containing protein n=1 Tax=Macrostomum lignano TaxID=282301 RepID=A0A1I8G7V4_9PLAT
MAERLHQQAKSPARTRTLLMMTSSSSKQSGNAESISGGKCSSQLKWRSVAAKSAKGSAGLGGSQKSQKEQQAGQGWISQQQQAGQGWISQQQQAGQGWISQQQQAGQGWISQGSNNQCALEGFDSPGSEMTLLQNQDEACLNEPPQQWQRTSESIPDLCTNGRDGQHPQSVLKACCFKNGFDVTRAEAQTRLADSKSSADQSGWQSPQSRCRSSEEQPETSQDHETVRDQLLLADFSDDELTDAEAESGELFLTPKPPVPKPRTRRTLTMEQPAAQVTQLDPALPINFNAAAPVPTPRRRRSQQQPQPVVVSTPDFEPLPPPPTLPVPRERHSRCRPSGSVDNQLDCEQRFDDSPLDGPGWTSSTTSQTDSAEAGAVEDDATVRPEYVDEALDQLLLTRSRLTQGLPAVAQPKTQAKGCSELANALTTARRPMEQPAVKLPAGASGRRRPAN